MTDSASMTTTSCCGPNGRPSFCATRPAARQRASIGTISPRRSRPWGGASCTRSSRICVQALLHDLKAEAWPLSRAVPHWRAEARGHRDDARATATRRRWRSGSTSAKLYREARYAGGRATLDGTPPTARARWLPGDAWRNCLPRAPTRSAEPSQAHRPRRGRVIDRAGAARAYPVREAAPTGRAILQFSAPPPATS